MYNLSHMNTSQKKILITGCSGYVGEMLVDQFSKREDVSLVIGIDLVLPTNVIKNNPKFLFIQENLGTDTWQETVCLHEPEIIVHTAWQIRELKDKDIQHRLNVIGSDNVFDFAFTHPFVKRLVYFSTVASYGAYKTNEIETVFTEENPFRKTEYLYAEEKRIVEKHLYQQYNDAINEHTNFAKVFIVRPVAITGPRGRFMRIRFGLQSALSGQIKTQKSFWNTVTSLLASVTPITKKWCRQFIHEDDVNDIVELLSFNDIDSDFEIFNISPPGPVVTGEDMAKAVKKKSLTLHPRIVQFAFFVVRTLSFGKIPTSKGAWKSYSYPVVVDGSKISKKYGYTYRMNSLDAFTKNEGRYENYVKE